MFGKRFLALVMTLCMVSAVFVPMPLAVSAEDVVESDSINGGAASVTQDVLDTEAEKPAHPNATVSVLVPTVLKAGDYSVFDGSLHDGEEDLPLHVVMNFRANETLEQAIAGGFGKWRCDFYLTFSGIK